MLPSAMARRSSAIRRRRRSAATAAAAASSPRVVGVGIGIAVDRHCSSYRTVHGRSRPFWQQHLGTPAGAPRASIHRAPCASSMSTTATVTPRQHHTPRARALAAPRRSPNGCSTRPATLAPAAARSASRRPAPAAAPRPPPARMRTQLRDDRARPPTRRGAPAPAPWAYWVRLGRAPRAVRRAGGLEATPAAARDGARDGRATRAASGAARGEGANHLTRSPVDWLLSKQGYCFYRQLSLLGCLSVQLVSMGMAALTSSQPCGWRWEPDRRPSASRAAATWHRARAACASGVGRLGATEASGLRIVPHDG